MNDQQAKTFVRSVDELADLAMNSKEGDVGEVVRKILKFCVDPDRNSLDMTLLRLLDARQLNWAMDCLHWVILSGQGVYFLLDEKLREELSSG